jgi:hypothetical protein
VSNEQIATPPCLCYAGAMTAFRITGLSPRPFEHLFGLSDERLATFNVRRYVADAMPGYPDRVELRDVQAGEHVLLVNYVHQPGDTPYRASHAIFVREGATERFDAIDVVPDVLRIRPISLRAFDRADMMIDADLTEGPGIENVIDRFFTDPHVSYVQAHFAKRGCYAARIERA